MTKANKKSKEMAIFEKIFSKKKVKWWHRDMLFFPLSRKKIALQQNKRNLYYQESQKLINKGHLLEYPKDNKRFWQRQVRPKKNKLLKREQQIQNEKDLAKSW